MSHEGGRLSSINHLAASDVPFIKIAVIGDSGVGKTTFSSVLSSGCFESSPIYRSDCSELFLNRPSTV